MFPGYRHNRLAKTSAYNDLNATLSILLAVMSEALSTPVSALEFLAAAEKKLQQGRAAEALAMLQNWLHHFSAPSEDRDTLFAAVRYHVMRGVALAHLNRFPEALEAQLMAGRFAEMLPEPSLRARVYLNQGNLHRETGDWDRALDLYARSRQEASAAGDKRTLGMCENNIGDIHEQMGNLTEALHSYRYRLEIAHEEKDEQGIALVNCNLGSVLSKIGQPEEGWRHFQISLETYRRIENRLGIAAVMSYMVDFLSRFGSLEELRGAATEGLELCQSIGHQLFQAKILYYWAVGLLREGAASPQRREAISALERALQLVEELRAEEWLYRVHEALAKAWEAEGESSRALTHYKLFRDQRDRLFHDRFRLRLASQTTLHEAEKARQEMALERKKNSELQQINHRLEKAIQDKNAILGIAAHDLKNPLGTIITLMDILREEEGIPDNVQDIVKSVHADSFRMYHLIEDMLEMNRMDSGVWQPRSEEFDAASLLLSVIELHEVSASKKNIRIQVDAPEVLPVRQDARACRHVWENLLSNAIKYTPPGRNVFLDLCRDAGGMGLFFRIRDEGPGFSVRDRDKLFQRFAKLSARPTAGESSSGLGLSIVKQMVDACGGQIACVSEPGQSAIFELLLPEMRTT